MAEVKKKKAEVIKIEKEPEVEHLPRIEIEYDRKDRRRPYHVTFFNCGTRSVFQKMIMHLLLKELTKFRGNLIMEGSNNGGE